ncbi:Short chain fatty acid transporter [Paraburkholderia piptadeniae]|uniref:Short chain fatty acid transporter n=1 Tax=Paraburkholderia piptadeniae TaxID=1701573 RepID=A0A1N7RVI8_9BURK|nr:TIGR00366 family protein [Paraburkholderia piptadeniae]SIT39106.1 Short chain fatty acid transporter [Paraburkholderia piptadeniae]
MDLNTGGLVEASDAGSRELVADPADTKGFERLAIRISNWMERWFPDSFVIAMLAVLAVAVGALLIGAPTIAVVKSFGDGLWKLLPFSMQMALVVVTGYTLAVSPPMRKLITWVAAVPRNGKSAVAYIVLIANLTALLNWGFGLIFAGLLVRALARRRELKMDYRAASAAAFMGIGAVDHLGLSSSAALLHATPASLPKELFAISGLIPFGETIFTWQNLVTISVMTAVAMLVAYVTAPTGKYCRTAADLKISVGDEVKTRLSTRPGDWLENSPLLVIVVGGMLLGWLAVQGMSKGWMAMTSDLNSYLILVLALSLLAQWRPARFLKAVSDSVPSVGGVIVQFPIYAGVAAILTTAMNASGHPLSHYISEFFIGLSGEHGLPVIVSMYSIFMGFVVPSAGAKWVLEAPYILSAGTAVHSNLAWLVMTYNGSEALANLINPFWMVPLLGIVGLKARNIITFTFLQFVFLAPVTVLTFWLLSFTMQWHLPVFP